MTKNTPRPVKADGKPYSFEEVTKALFAVPKTAVAEKPRKPGKKAKGK